MTPAMLRLDDSHTLTITLKLTGVPGHSEFKAARQAVTDAMYEFQERQCRANPPRMGLLVSGMYFDATCAITGYPLQGGDMEYILLDTEGYAPVSPDFVCDVDPVLFKAGQIVADAWLCFIRMPHDDGKRLLDELTRIIKEELYRTETPEALQARLAPLLINVPPIPEGYPLTLSFAPDDLTGCPPYFEPDAGADIPFGPPRRLNDFPY